MRSRWTWPTGLACGAALLAVSATAQPPSDHTQHSQTQAPADHAAHDASAMRGALGDYPMTRETSGTAWQPDSAPLAMRHWQRDGWDLMGTAFATAVYTDAEASTRGDQDELVQSMGMLMAQRPWRRGMAGLRGMLSLDPALVG